MSFTQLPPELLLQIESYMDESDIASLVQVNRHVYQTLILPLYRHNIESGGTAIIRAAQSGNCFTLKKALQTWSDSKGSAELPTLDDRYQWSPLLLAAIRGNIAAVNMLLDYGVDPNIRDQSGRTPLLGASSRGHIAVVKALLAHPEIKVNAYDRERKTAICGAAQFGHVEIFKMLLCSGAHAGGGPGRLGTAPPPLYSAIKKRQPELARLLVNREDVDPNALYSNETPLAVAVSANREDLVQIILTDKRVDPNLSPKNDPPLLSAAIRNNKTIIRLLLEAGANKELQTEEGLSPAMLLDAPSAQARSQILSSATKSRINKILGDFKG